MMFVLFLIFIKANKKICLCDVKCPDYCPLDSYSGEKFNINFADYYNSQLINENNLEMYLYTTNKGVLYQFDSNLLKNKNIVFKNLPNSQTIQIKFRSQSENKIISLDPNYQVFYPDSIPVYLKFNDHAKSLYEAESLPPTPARTAHEGSTDSTYIDKEFTGSIPVSDTNQIQLGGDGQIKQISACHFTDLDITNCQFFIKVNGESSIFDNVFERTTYMTGKAGCIWHAFQSSNKFIISNCKFIKIVGHGDDASVLNVNSATVCHIAFQDCEFQDCGEKGNDRPIVNVLHQDSTIKFNNCDFSYEDPQISRVLELKGNGATFDKCRFNNCGENTIDLGIEDITTTTHQSFQFTNNIVRTVNTRFINAPRIRAKPVISNNTFEDITLDGKYFIYILHDQSEIEFNSNTFSNIVHSGTTEGNCGGLSSFVERSGSKFKLIYKECHFNNIINQHSSHPMSQGGALQYFSDNNFEVDIELNKCEFKSNKAYLHGGAISIQTSGNILIQECNFEMNEANYRSSSSKLLYENYYDQKTNGFGGAIYLNPTFNKNGVDYCSTEIRIEGCTFNKNRGYQGYAIYIEGEESTTIYSIINNNFNNNYESTGSPNTNSIIASEDLQLTKEIIENANAFSNTEEGSTSEKFMRVDRKGKLLPEGNCVFGDENFTSLLPTDRIEKELDILSVNDTAVKFTVVVSEISSKVNQDGGAIHIINCALKCIGTNFTECKSPNGAGGGIYIKNSGGSENNANLIGLTFTRCEADYGGAVYIYSNLISNGIIISHCTFIGNKATGQSSSSDSILYGGSGVFLTAKKGSLSNNIFKNNEGEGGALRLYNTYDEDAISNNMKLLNGNNNALLITDCSFEIAKNTGCCLNYLRGKKGANVELQKCIFTGVLAPESHYIDGKTISKDDPKLLVKKCVFSDDSTSSLNMKDYMSIDLNDQSFLFDKSAIKISKKIPFSTWMIISAACVVVVVAVVIIVIFVMKRRNPNHIEENEMSTEIRDLLIDETNTLTTDNSVVNSSLI